MLKITDAREKVEIYGKIVEIKKPTWGEIKSLENKTKDNPESAADVLKGFLCHLGLDNETFDKMPPSDSAKLVKYLCGGNEKK